MLVINYTDKAAKVTIRTATLADSAMACLTLTEDSMLITEAIVLVEPTEAAVAIAESSDHLIKASINEEELGKLR